MSAVKDDLLTLVEDVMRERGIDIRDDDAFDRIQDELLNDPGPLPTGYMCKRCGGPSPVGVGYVDSDAKCNERAEAVLSCPCGYSRKAEAMS